MANDPALLAKMSNKLKRSAPRVREGISHRAARWGVVSEAAQVLWAKELGISPGRVLGKLPPHVQQQVREHLNRASERSSPPVRGQRARRHSAAKRAGDGLRAAVSQLITDPELIAVCADILKLTRRFDRAINHATQVLEQRLRSIAGPAAQKNAKAQDVAAIVLLSSRGPMLRLDSDNAVQDGYYSTCAGLFASFRNPTHHGAKKFSREDAISVCGFINVLLDAFAHGTRAAAAPISAPAAPAKAAS